LSLHFPFLCCLRRSPSTTRTPASFRVPHSVSLHLFLVWFRTSSGSLFIFRALHRVYVWDQI
jgi:hypothetical protein